MGWVVRVRLVDFESGADKSHGSSFANARFAKLRCDLVAPVLKQTGPLDHGRGEGVQLEERY